MGTTTAAKKKTAAPADDAPKGGYVVLWAKVGKDGVPSPFDVITDGTAEKGSFDIRLPKPKVYTVDSQEKARKAAAADILNGALRDALGLTTDGDASKVNPDAPGVVMLALPLSSFHPSPGRIVVAAPKVSV